MKIRDHLETDGLNKKKTDGLNKLLLEHCSKSGNFGNLYLYA